MNTPRTESPYRAALAHISTNPGTSSALGLSKLILSLYNRAYPFSLAECTFGFDELRNILAGQMVMAYLQYGETDDLLDVGARIKALHPELVEQAEFVREAKLARRQQEFMQSIGGGGMHSTQLDRLDEYAQRLINNADDGKFGVLSTGERAYVLLAASRADLLAEYGDTVPEALSRLGKPDVEALMKRWEYRHYQPYVPGVKRGGQ
jgi:hypothetical protein